MRLKLRKKTLPATLFWGQKVEEQSRKTVLSFSHKMHRAKLAVNGCMVIMLMLLCSLLVEMLPVDALANKILWKFAP